MAFIRTRIWAMEKRTVMKKALIFWSWVIQLLYQTDLHLGLAKCTWEAGGVESLLKIMIPSLESFLSYACRALFHLVKLKMISFACMVSRGTLIPINATLRTKPCWELCNLLVIKKVSSGLLYFKTTLLWASQSDATLPLSLTKLESALIVIIFGVQFLHWESYQMVSRYQKDIDAVYILNMIWRIWGRMKPFILGLNLKSLA